MQYLSETEELELFETRPIMELIEYKWDRFAYKFHSFGCIMHIIYMLTLTIYIEQIYCKPQPLDHQEMMPYNIILALGILYPLIYDNIQLFR